jgi:hypothetical protein
MPQTVRVRPRPELVLAAVLSMSVVGGTAVLVAQHGDSADPAAAAPATLTPTPEPASPTAVPTPAARPTPPTTRTPKPAARPLYPLPAPAIQPQPCPAPPLPPGKPRPFPAPVVAEAAVPAPVSVPARQVSLHAVAGKGMWITSWPKTRLDAAAVVRKAKAAGLRQVWVRTGGTKQGYYGDALLESLLPPAHAAGIAVIAWDFPTLSDPLADVERAVRALSYTVQGQRLDGFAPDIETKAEGVHLTSKRVTAYLSRVQLAAGDRPVVDTVPRPTKKRLASYPYTASARYSDGFTAMVYWSCLEPGATTLAAIRDLKRFHRHVAVVGQAYDMGPEGGRRGLPSGAETWRFLDVAKRGGAFGASLYTYDTAGPHQWGPLGAYPWR